MGLFLLHSLNCAMALTTNVLKGWRQELLDNDWVIHNAKESLIKAKELFKQKIEEDLSFNPLMEDDDQERCEAELLMDLAHFDCVLKSLDQLHNINEHSRECFNSHSKP